MSESMDKIGFIGAGNMAEALAGAVIHAGLYSPDNVYMSDVRQDRLDMLHNTYQIHGEQDNFTVFSKCGMVVFAVKPQQMADVLSDISGNADYGIFERKIVVSIAAGIRIENMEKALYPPLDAAAQSQLPIIRVMPNTPALVLAGISGISPNRHAAAEDLNQAKAMLQAVGEVIEFKEEDLDAVTGVSGSGPAYALYLIESMTEAGIRRGLKPEEAATLALQTVKGAAILVEKTGESPRELRRKVTSPGGTTQAAFEVLEINNVKQSIIDAIGAATRRARELSN